MLACRATDKTLIHAEDSQQEASSDSESSGSEASEAAESSGLQQEEGLSGVKRLQDLSEDDFDEPESQELEKPRVDVEELVQWVLHLHLRQLGMFICLKCFSKLCDVQELAVDT